MLWNLYQAAGVSFKYSNFKLARGILIFLRLSTDPILVILDPWSKVFLYPSSPCIRGI